MRQPGMSQIGHSVSVFRRRRKEPDRIPRSFATTSRVSPGPFDEYPNREPEAAWAHANHYEEQRKRLVAKLEAQGRSDDLWVAKVFAVQRPDGGAHTYVTWTEGIKTLLAPADVVLLVEQPPEAAAKPAMTLVRWDVTAHVCADDCWKLMLDFDPPRLLTVGWPTPHQLEVLKSRKLP